MTHKGEQLARPLGILAFLLPPFLLQDCYSLQSLVPLFLQCFQILFIRQLPEANHRHKTIKDRHSRLFRGLYRYRGYLRPWLRLLDLARDELDSRDPELVEAELQDGADDRCRARPSPYSSRAA